MTKGLSKSRYTAFCQCKPRISLTKKINNKWYSDLNQFSEGFHDACKMANRIYSEYQEKK